MPASCSASRPGPLAATKDKPNVIVILGDDVGYGDLGCYGATKVKTPYCDAHRQAGHPLHRRPLVGRDVHAVALLAADRRVRVATKGTGILPGNGQAVHRLPNA